MKLKTALIAWNPNQPLDANDGTEIRVDSLETNYSSGWADNYFFSGGASFREYKQGGESLQAMRAYRDFVTLVIRDGMNPKAVYDQFIKIDEFEKFLPEDIPGVKL